MDNTLLPLTLNASLGNFGVFVARRSAMSFRKQALAVFKRDSFTCQYCGFRTNAFLEVVNRDGDYQNNKLDNLTTACAFCAQCHFVESVSDDGYGAGTLIYLPELPQASVNVFCRSLFISMLASEEQQEKAQSLYQVLKARAQVIEGHFGEGMSDPKNFGRLWLDFEMQQGKTTELTTMISQLRLLPARGRFRKQIAIWAEARYKLERARLQQSSA